MRCSTRPLNVWPVGWHRRARAQPHVHMRLDPMSGVGGAVMWDYGAVEVIGTSKWMRRATDGREG